MGLEEYLDHVKTKCKKHGVKLVLKNKKHFLEEGVSMGGYLSEEPLELGVATKKPQKIWVPFLLHEDSHLDQLLEQSPLFTQTKIRGVCASEIITNWVEGKDYSPNTIQQAIALIRDMELDCERRALKKIKKFQLQINPQHYIQTAAINIHQYNYTLKRRLFLRRGNALPYEDKSILETMPTTLRGNFRRLTNKQLAAFDNYMENA